ncbi:hypothetical protein GUJ93_ZPchr0010g8255 [Zizania palustris]|uniref:Acetyltransferase n=1 Tax=Zizania palustris TaxID=103762 RepID=A0A8J6BG81_ZIZPA|nr:hypothetical protein GUJ93_ZPchr0010g8255 [Zizania palustris]
MVLPESTSLQNSELPEPETTVHLTPWDLPMITVEYIQKGLLLHEPPTGGERFVERLASSLARVLGRFYPFAGRLAEAEKNDDGAASPPSSISISLCCNNEGAEFVHAEAPGVTTADIASSLYIPRVVWSFFPLNGLLDADAATGSLPVLAVQITELSDGVFIGVSLNHVVGDGTTFWQFINAWAEISRSSDGKLDMSPSPVWERWFLDTCPVPIPLPFAKLEDIIRRCEHSPPLQECFFSFSRESTRKLKVKANGEMGGGSAAAISSLQALLALVWRSVSRARGLGPCQETAYLLAVGCRGRVTDVSPDYVGNAVVVGAVNSTAGEIQEKGLGWTAWQLNRLVASFDEAAIRNRLSSWLQQPVFSSVAKVMGGTTVLTGSSPRFDVFGNDFGWGKPVAVRSGGATKFDGKVTVYEGRDGGGSMALEVCLAPATLAKLVADVEFMDAVSTEQ